MRGLLRSYFTEGLLNALATPITEIMFRCVKPVFKKKRGDAKRFINWLPENPDFKQKSYCVVDAMAIWRSLTLISFYVYQLICPLKAGILFHFVLMPLKKTGILQFFSWLWINNRANWFLQPLPGNQPSRKTLTLSQLDLEKMNLTIPSDTKNVAQCKFFKQLLHIELA